MKDITDTFTQFCYAKLQRTENRLYCLYPIYPSAARFKFRVLETCSTCSSPQSSHLGTIKNLLRNFAVQNCSRPAAVKTGFTNFYFFAAAPSFAARQNLQLTEIRLCLSHYVIPSAALWCAVKSHSLFNMEYQTSSIIP